MKSASTWEIQLVLDGVDVSKNLSGQLSIEREENAASIAEFTLVPFAGPISVTKWIGKHIEIYYIEDGIKHHIFRGVVDEPVYDPTTRLTQFTCSDQLQEHIEQLDRSQIDWGYWSDTVFSGNTDNWRYAQDRLSTTPQSISLDLANNLRLTSWQAKSVPDFEFKDDDIVYQSIRVQLANRRQIHNSAQITFQYRYQCFKQREIQFDYRYPLSLCGQLKDNATMPNVEMINKAIEGTGWLLKSKPEFVHQFPGGWYMCDGEQVAFVITPELQSYLVREVRFTLMKRFVQTVTDEYQLNIEAPQSINQLGTLSYKTQYALEIPAKPDDFKSITDYESPLPGAVMDSHGDYVLVQDDINRFNQASNTLFNLAKTQILDSHRQNLITFQTTLQPSIDTEHTVLFNSQNVKAQAKVKSIVHQCDFDQGSSLSTITLAVSRTDDLMDVTESSLTLNHQTDLGEPPATPNRIELPTYFGGAADAPEFDDSWDGYSGNKAIQPNPIMYSEQFAITLPQIDQAQAPQLNTINQSFNIAIPNELLEMTA